MGSMELLGVFDRLAGTGSREVQALADPASGLCAWIAIDRPELGPAFGGVRRCAYADEGAALADALRLARAMTVKCALYDLPAGGAKAVVRADRLTDPERAYRRLGRAVERLGGRFFTGPDVGTGPAELAWLAAETRYVTRPDDAGPGEIGRATATGVERAIEAALAHADAGGGDPSGRTIVIQGLGDVGARLARSLAARGARVLGVETDPERLARAVADCGVEPLNPGAEYAMACDVFAPCAVGGLLDEPVARSLRARVVCGSANNVLADELAADALARREILFVPDPVASAGGLLLGATFHLEERRPSFEEIGRRVAETTARVLERARADRATPLATVEREVRESLAARGEDHG